MLLSFEKQVSGPHLMAKIQTNSHAHIFLASLPATFLLNSKHFLKHTLLCLHDSASSACNAFFFFSTLKS